MGSTTSWSSSRGRVPLPPAMLSLSGMSTASSSGGEFSPSTQLVAPYHYYSHVSSSSSTASSRGGDLQSRLTQVEHAIADQAKLLYQIQCERDRQSAVTGRTTIGTQQDWV
ncbi:hypothetical protein PINS_up011311 [Pythium insidiosum]|nr:hypothetical protein PINS_up011311 [Pythium insidiosum]